MNVIQKSLLDLIPLTIVAIVIALISANTVRDVSQTYDSIISVEAELLVSLRDAQSAVLQWNADVKEGASLIRNNGEKATDKFVSATFNFDEYIFNVRSARQKIEALLSEINTTNSSDSEQTSTDQTSSTYVDQLAETDTSLVEVLSLVQALETAAVANKDEQLKASKLSLGTGAELDQAVSEMIEAQNKLGNLVILALSANSRATQSVSVAGEDLVQDVQILNGVNLDVLDVENVLFDIEDIRKKLSRVWGTTDKNEIARQSAYITMLRARLSALDYLIGTIKDKEAEIKDLITSRASRVEGKDRLSLFVNLDYAGKSLEAVSELKTAISVFQTIGKMSLANQLEVNEIVQNTDAAAKASNRKLTATIKLINERIDRLQEVTSETVSSRQLNVWALTIGGILAALAIGFLVARKTILKPMMLLTNIAREVAETGNFSKRIGISSTDEIGKASQSIDKLLENTQQAFLDIEILFSKVAEGNLTARMPENYQGDIGRASNHIATSLGRLSSTLEKILLDVQQVASASASAGEAVGQIAEGARAQVEATKSIQERMSTSVQIASSVDESAKSTSTAAINATQVATLGSKVAGDMVSIMSNIQDNSSKISEIVDLIQDIAQQTTMLAINASIESARAGEAGRGFSVVATEVGKLADRSSSSVKNILELTTAADDKANHGSTQMGELQQEMLRIGETIKEIESMMTAIVKESTKQREALTQVEDATNNLERIGEDNAVAAEEITASMLQLSRVASHAKSSIGEFTLLQKDPSEDTSVESMKHQNESSQSNKDEDRDPSER